MSFTKSEFAEWRDMDITQALFKELLSFAEGTAAEIINRQDENPKRDMYCKGLIKAVDLVVSWKPEFTPKVRINQETGLLEDIENVD